MAEVSNISSGAAVNLRNFLERLAIRRKFNIQGGLQQGRNIRLPSLARRCWALSRSFVMKVYPEGPVIPARSLGWSQRHPGNAESALDYVRDFESDSNDTGFLVA